MEDIQPEEYDVIMVTTGLPEVLIASALAKAGKTVLLIDGADYYGSGWASVAGPAFSAMLEHRGGIDGSLDQEPGGREQQIGDCELMPLVLSDVRALEGVSLYQAANTQAFAARDLIIDLCPKVVYQGEQLVDTLVASGAASYLDFKLVDASYMLQHGRLAPVPASRADIFQDRRLGLAEKRTLMAFIKACQEAGQGEGRLQACFDHRPLAELLQQEGLSGHLADVVLYGTAMCAQPQPQQPLQPPLGAQKGQPREGAPQLGGGSPSDAAPTPHAGGPAARDAAPDEGTIEAAGGALAQGTAADAATGACTAPAPTQPGGGGRGGSGGGGGCMTAAEGLAALRLYAASLGRYSGRGAFLVPSYGSGALVEAFVRLAAVRGAVTVLRRSVLGVLVGSELGRSLPGAAAAGTAQPVGPQTGEAETGGVHPAGAETGGPQPWGAETGAAKTEAAETEAAQPGVACVDTQAAQVVQQAGKGGRRCCGVVLSSGQVLSCGALVANSRALRALAQQYGRRGSSDGGHAAGEGGRAGRPAPAPAAAAAIVARAVCVLDGPLVEGDGSCMLVVSPGAGGGAGPAAVVRGLQLSATTHVAPRGRCLLYLTALLPDLMDSGGSSVDVGSGGGSSGSELEGSCGVAEQVLRPVMELLVQTGGLQRSGGRGGPAAGSSGASRGSEAADDAAAPAAGSCRPDVRPTALALVYFSRRLGQPWGDVEQVMPPGVICCPEADDGCMVGYGDALTAAEQLLRRHWPGVPWLTDPAPIGQAEARHVLDKGEEDAIDELAMALETLSAAVPAET